MIHEFDGANQRCLAALFCLAHRTLIVRKLKGLEDIISFTSVHWFMGEQGNNMPCLVAWVQSL